MVQSFRRVGSLLQFDSALRKTLFQGIWYRRAQLKALAKRMQHHSTLLNSTLLDGVVLRGQTNATCCAEQTQIPEMRDLGRIMIPNFRRTTTLAWEMTCYACESATMLESVATRVQLCCSHMRTKETLNDVASNVWWKSNFVQHHRKWCNMMQHVGQTSSTCSIQQCWTILNRDVVFVWPGLKYRVVAMDMASIVIGYFKFMNWNETEEVIPTKPGNFMSIYRYRDHLW